MKTYLIIFNFILLISFALQASTTTGSIELDELSFDKITKKFEVSLVKFDVAFPYGDKHEAFVSLAKDAIDEDELLIAEVGVKDYGEKDNEHLASKYGATKENFPIVKLFIRGKDKPITFDETKGFTSDQLRIFIRENTGLYLNLPGCVKELDLLATEFMKAKTDDRKQVFTKMENLKISEKVSASAKIYKAIMQKVLEKGDQFIQSEHERVKKILTSKVSEEKKKELASRINILMSFELRDKDKNGEKNEL